jgi:hypothetical protein
MTLLIRLTPLIPLITALAACSDPSSSSSFQETAESMEGIYRVTSHTNNLEACEPGGDVVTGVDGYIVVAYRPILERPFLDVTSCANPADCLAKRASLDQGEGISIDFSFGFERVEDDGTIVGGGASTGFNMNGICTQGTLWDTSATLDGEILTIRKQLTLADDYPAEDESCSTDLTRNAAAGNDCSQMEILTATFVEAL